MFRKLFLLICLTFFVIGFAYPCVILPVGSYSAKTGTNEVTSFSFSFDGKVEIAVRHKVKEGEDSSVITKGFYKLDKDQVIISSDEIFDKDNLHIRIASIYRLEGGYQNIASMIVSGGVGIIAILLVITIPSKRKIKAKLEK